MKAVKRKLESRAGASILISLMFFLVVMMVGVVCLVAAYNNSGRATHARDDVQRYNAVESAMNLLIEDFKAEKAKFVLTETDNEGVFRVDIPQTNRITDNNNVNPKYGKLLYTLMKKTGEQLHNTADGYIEYTPYSSKNVEDGIAIVQGGKSSSSGKGYGLTFEASYGTDTLPDVAVKGTVQVGEKYFNADSNIKSYDALDFDITIQLWYEEKSNHYYTTTLVFPACIRKMNIYNAVDETVTEKVEISWYEPQITREEAE